jgi:hypothetical protein
MTFTIKNIDVRDFPQDTAYQAELNDGAVFTGRWTGLVAGEALVFDHVDTGFRLHLADSNVRWFMPLEWVRPDDPNTVDDRVVAMDRKESEPCQAGTPGCCINHDEDHGSCETW